MTNIRPSSDLRNKYNEISEFCHKYQEPVFITKNGTGDLVVSPTQNTNVYAGGRSCAGCWTRVLPLSRLDRADRPRTSLQS